MSQTINFAQEILHFDAIHVLDLQRRGIGLWHFGVKHPGVWSRRAFLAVVPMDDTPCLPAIRS